MDYDKPGFLTVCADCAHASSESRIAFVCVDCRAHTVADATPTQDIFTYEVTDRGRAYLDTGHAYLGQAQHALRFVDLPLDLVVSLNTEARRYNEEHTPFVLLNFGYRNAREIEREHGHRQFEQTRDLFLENFRNAIGGEAIFAKGYFYDFALVKGERRENVASRLDDFSATARRPLQLDLGVTIQAFGPEDFA